MEHSIETKKRIRLHNHLCSAAVFGDVKAARCLLARGAEVNHPTRLGTQSPLFLACARGDREMVGLYREAGANIGPAEAALLGETELLRGHLDRGVDVESLLPGWNAPLIAAAAFSGNLETVQLLVERGANVAPGGAVGRRSPIAVAARKGHREVAAYLAQISSSVGFLDAIMLGDVDRGTAFLDAGADPNTPIDKLLPLSAAARSGQVAVARLLLDRGANTLESAVWEARRGGWSQIVLLLQEYGLPAEDDALNGNRSVGADIDQRDAKGRTALMRAIWGGRPEQVRSLLAHGADPRLTDHQGQTALNLIEGWSWRHGVEIQTLLLDLGLDVNTQDNEGMTPLMRAIRHGGNDLVQLYVDRGADRTLRDVKGRAALDLVGDDPDLLALFAA